MQKFEQVLNFWIGGMKQLWASKFGKFVLLGLVIGAFYFPAWFRYLFERVLLGKSGWFLILTLLFLAAYEIWTHREKLNKLSASEEDQLLGATFIVCAALLFPFFRFALWSQAFLWLIVLIGIVLILYGVRFFGAFTLSTSLIALTVYPRVGLISRTVWEILTPPGSLENIMATISATLLRLFGWAANASGEFIVFPDGAVIVGWGCNGLDMAITMGILSLFIGIIWQQPYRQIFALIPFVCLAALIANIPRLMLVSVAYVYWGTDWFKFWHGFWGGQIFVSLLFTMYYYAVSYYLDRQKALVDRQ